MSGSNRWPACATSTSDGLLETPRASRVDCLTRSPAMHTPWPRWTRLPKPPYLSFEEAAAMPLVFLTAWNMLVSNARLRFGEDVLIWGAGSGVGSAGIQIARLLAARGVS